MAVVEERDFSSSGQGATEYIIGGDANDGMDTSFPETEGSTDDGSLGNFDANM